MTKITMYGADWCRDCIRSKRFLDEHDIEYEYLDIEQDPDLAETVINYNIEAGYGAKRRIPIILVDSIVLSEPSNEDLAKVLDIKE